MYQASMIPARTRRHPFFLEFPNFVPDLICTRGYCFVPSKAALIGLRIPLGATQGIQSSQALGYA